MDNSAAASPRRPVRIGNFAGFYGDRIDAAREMVEGGPLDAITGDFLAELTMLILWKARQKDPSGGYAKTFLTQMEAVLGTCLNRGIKVIANAGGLNPSGLARDLGELATRLGLSPRIAYVTGDNIVDRIDELLDAGVDLRHLDTGQLLSETNLTPVTANAYLGGWAIKECLDDGADVVICPRVTDASLVVGTAAWWHAWSRDDFDALSGAVAAGHVIECGPQACGGNYSWIDEISDRRYPGFPIAEIAADGSSVITKHDGTGGLVSKGTVTAQLLYEVASPAYLNPDVVAHFDSLRLEDDGPNRVRISGSRGTPPPPSLKVALNHNGGYRNSMTMVLTGLDIEEKARWATDLLFDQLGGRDQFGEVEARLVRSDKPDASSQELASAHLTITVKDPDPQKVGRRFSNATTSLFLGGYPGCYFTSPPTSESAYGVYWPTTIPAKLVEQVAVLPDGTSRVVPHTTGADTIERSSMRPSVAVTQWGETRTAPLGLVAAARSGDKGGNANVGLWTRTEAAYAWLREALTVDVFQQLLPEAADLAVERHDFPNLWALNFVVVGLLGEGVASSTRPDAQAKGLGEFLRSRYMDIPASLLA